MSVWRLVPQRDDCAAILIVQTKMGKKTTMHTINPKAITVSELYGLLDPGVYYLIRYNTTFAVHIKPFTH